MEQVAPASVSSMDRDVVEQAHEIYFNVIIAHGDADEPWSPEQRSELRRALSMLEPLDASGELGPEGIQLMASLCLELGQRRARRASAARGSRCISRRGRAARRPRRGVRESEPVVRSRSRTSSAAVLLGVDDPDEQLGDRRVAAHRRARRRAAMTSTRRPCGWSKAQVKDDARDSGSKMTTTRTTPRSRPPIRSGSHSARASGEHLGPSSSLTSNTRAVKKDA